MTFAQQVLQFNLSLPATLNVPQGIEVLFPYELSETVRVMTAFYERFYNDLASRTFIFGINPGRFGAGITGVPFTDPIRLEAECGIRNDFAKKPELSSEFVYQFIHAFGGLEVFYQKFYITSLSPLGFIRHDKNYNYYDDRALQIAIEPFIVSSIQKQLEFPCNRQIAFCLGQGKNAAFFQNLNARYHFFATVAPLPHPRWIMQYRRKQLMEFVDLYVSQLRKAIENKE